uniref:Placental growth factor n=1 Tax=Chelydra serpentina TaxID=8475 RepID=A0A8C3RN55_CHESE
MLGAACNFWDTQRGLLGCLCQVHGTPPRLCPHSASPPSTSGSLPVLPFQEVWGRSFCRPLEMLVDIVSEYPSEVEHMFSPSCISLQRCTGCCGDETLQCVPVETTNVTMQVRARWSPVLLGHQKPMGLERTRAVLGASWQENGRRKAMFSGSAEPGLWGPHILCVGNLGVHV